mgnify:CR=1 FL=1|tara:strand:- start:98 stop:277 length:180 start_codon:yes stop_codon:yes gene_type:complete
MVLAMKGVLIKISTPFTIFKRFLKALNYKEMYVKNISNDCMNHKYWDKECLEHPTNNSF